MKYIKEKIFLALGEVSVCWSEIPNGIFDSTKAVQIGETLYNDIEKYIISKNRENKLKRILK